MSDIVLIRRRNRVRVIAESAQAEKYLKGKHIGFDNYFNAPEEDIEELIKDYKNDGFTVEEL